MKQAEPLLYDELIRHQQSLLPDLEKQIYDLHTLAIEGNVESIFRLSGHYQTGMDVSEDQYLAFRLIRFAAELDYQQAFTILGKHYAFGIGTPKNPIEAVHWFIQTDYSQDLDIQAFMAWCYYTGTGVTKDEQQAFDHWIRATFLGHPDGFRFCQIAADAGYAPGQYALGLCYKQGIGAPTDIQTALRLFHLAAEQNYAEAQCQLGFLYGDGEYGIERDPTVAVQWFRLAAAQNHIIARNRLAECLMHGEGVEKNIDEAVQILREPAQESSDFSKGEPSCQYQLGTLLIDNEYVGYNPREGIKWFRKSAEQNYPLAQAALGMVY
jgi:TPR repeat protein